MTGHLLDGLYQSAYSKEIESLLKQSKIFGVALFGDGATIKKVPLCPKRLLSLEIEK